MSRSIALLASALLVIACAYKTQQYDMEHGYSIRHEKQRSVLLFEGHEVTVVEGRGDYLFEGGDYSISPSGRYVFFRSHGNLYLFDSTTRKSRFLRGSPFRCMEKWYEAADPPVVRCFDVYERRMIEIRLD